MATTLYPTDTLASLTISGVTVRTLSTLRGSGVVTKSQASVTAATDVFDTGSTPLAFAIRLNAVTFANSAWTINVWGRESNAMANNGASPTVTGNYFARIYANDGTAGTAFTGTTSNSTEYGTTAAARAPTLTPNNGPVLAAGDWLVIFPKHVNVGSGATGYTIEFSYNGTSAAADGDSYFTLPDTLTEYTASVTATPGVVSLVTSTFAPTVTATNHQLVTPGVASLITAAFAPNVTLGVRVVPTTASLSLSTFAPTVALSDNQTVTPSTAVLATATFAPTVSVSDNQSVTPGVVALVTATFAPTITVTANVTVTPDVVALATVTFAPTVTTSDHQSVTPTTAALALSTFAPTVTVAAGGITVTPGVASLSLATFAPSIAVSDNQTVTPGVVALSLASFAPNVLLTDNQLVTPGAASLALSMFTATVLATAHQTVTPTTAALVLSPFAPTVTVANASVTVIPGVATLALTTYAPTVTGSAAEASPYRGGPPLGAATVVGPARPRYPRRPVRVTPRAARLKLTTFRPSVVVNDDETAIAFLLGAR